MNAWTLVPCGFGFWWIASGLSALGFLSGWSWSLLVTAAAVVAACGFVRRRRTRIIDRRTFRFSVLAESGGITIVVLGCGFSQRPDLIMPLVGTVVGLHLLPLARAFDDRRFVLAGGLLAGIAMLMVQGASIKPNGLRGASAMTRMLDLAAPAAAVGATYSHGDRGHRSRRRALGLRFMD